MERWSCRPRQSSTGLGPVGDSSALGPVHVLGDHGVAVVPSVVEQGLNLGGYGEVRVLAVAGYPGVEGRRGRELVLLLHIEDVASLATCPVSRFFISHNNHRLTSPPIECPYSTCPRSPTVVLETWPETPILPKPSFS